MVRTHTTFRLSAIARLGGLGLMVAVIGLGLTNPTKGEDMSYGQVREFLATHTKLVELTDGEGARLAICPEWQGRVMTTTCDGLDGPSFGFLNSKFIEAGELDERFNNYGGENRLWLSPEGGQFSLWFKPGDEQKLDNWYTPAALNEGPWRITSGPNDPFYRMTRRMQFSNASATPFDVEVTRTVRLLDPNDLAKAFGAEAAALLASDDVKPVAYETIDTITNRGEPMNADKGLVSAWILCMLNASPQTVAIIPYKPGDESELGPAVQSDYFGTVPPERLKVLPEAVLFMADSHCRSKLGTSQRRARNVLGSINFADDILTLVHFSMPDNPTKHRYANNVWDLPQAEPFIGDVANSYNDGPPENGGPQMGAFYEIESLSPAVELATGASLTHHHRMVHVKADRATLTKLSKQVLGVDWETVRKEMIP